MSPGLYMYMYVTLTFGIKIHINFINPEVLMSIYNSSIKLPVIVSSYPAVVLILDFVTTQKLRITT